MKVTVFALCYLLILTLFTAVQSFAQVGQIGSTGIDTVGRGTSIDNQRKTWNANFLDFVSIGPSPVIIKQSASPGTAQTGNINVAGDIRGTNLYGNGAGITGLTGATGGVSNTGSTTIGADTDIDGVGEIAMQTRGVTRVRINNDGGVTWGASDLIRIYGPTARFVGTVSAASSHQYTSIADATSAASSGDQIHVDAGTYTTNITPGGKRLTYYINEEARLNHNWTIAAGDTIELIGGRLNGKIVQTDGLMTLRVKKLISTGPDSTLVVTGGRLEIIGVDSIGGPNSGVIIFAGTSIVNATRTGFFKFTYIKDVAFLTLRQCFGSYEPWFHTTDTLSRVDMYNGDFIFTQPNEVGAHIIETSNGVDESPPTTGGGIFNIYNSSLRHPPYATTGVMGSPAEFAGVYHVKIYNSELVDSGGHYGRAVALGGSGQSLWENVTIKNLGRGLYGGGVVATGSMIAGRNFNHRFSNVVLHSAISDGFTLNVEGRAIASTDTLQFSNMTFMGDSTTTQQFFNTTSGDAFSIFKTIAANATIQNEHHVNSQMYGVTFLEKAKADSVYSLNDLKIASPNTATVKAWNNWYYFGTIFGNNTTLTGKKDLFFQPGEADGRVRINDGAGTGIIDIITNQAQMRKSLLLLSGTSILDQNGAQLLSPLRITGWGAPTGTATRTSIATYTAPTISNPPTQAEVQAVADALQAWSRAMKALIDDLTTHGLIGP